ncbi:uncharacterized protein [Halyomorpha halys]|uniref:uncharacterized protein n=1 Tax=Halyomorpha halys TaxID=286706 RepID=UPI0006D51071|nr:carboxypeptidase Y [Halyomorpha halys]
MHIHKMFKRMHKKHGGPPPPMFHGMHGMWHHMMPKPHEMWHHMPKPHEMWPHMPHKMGHHKIHPHMFHKMHHKMHHGHKKHKKHHGRSSSSSSSSSSESEDESLVEGIDKVQIGDEQEATANPGDETPAPPRDGGMCKEKFKCKKGKHFKSKGNKEKCKHCFKKMRKDACSPYWMHFNPRREQPCRDSRYNKGIFHLPPPETSPDIEEGRVETEQNAPEETIRQARFDEVAGHKKSKIVGQHPLGRGQRRGDSVDYFMQSIAEQIKKLPEAKIAEAKLKILEVVNDMQLDVASEPNIEAENMNVENERPQEPQPETQSAS